MLFDENDHHLLKYSEVEKFMIIFLNTEGGWLSKTSDYQTRIGKINYFF